MSFWKKITLLTILLSSLMVYSVYSFDYKTILSKNEKSIDTSKSNSQTNIKENIILPTQTPIKSTNEVIKKVNIVKNIEQKQINIDKIPEKVSNKNKNSNLSQKSKQIQSSINEILADKKITFERRSTKITDDSYLVLKNISNLLSSNSNIKIEVAGHTDSRGSDLLNKKISQDRANSVMDSLLELGIDKNRIKAVGYGESFPIAKDDENGLSEVNRRVEFNIIGE